VKPAPFEYHAPTTIAEAVGLLSEHGGDANPLAGGQSLIPMLALRLTRFDHLVDLNSVGELQGIQRSNGHVRIGGMTRQATVEHDATVARDLPLLAQATPLIGHFQIRNRGTVGGSLAHADPASEYPAVALALGARFEIHGGGGARTVPAEDFFVGTWTTAVEAEELLTAVELPVWTGRCGFAVEEVARRHGDFAMVGTAAAVEVGDDGKVARAGISLFGVGSTPIKAGSVESALVGGDASSFDRAALLEIGKAAAADLDPPDDIHASGRYRKAVSAELIARALTRALQETSRG
jgi:carbon-monoxide dehydrogenase medium subunit